MDNQVEQLQALRAAKSLADREAKVEGLARERAGVGPGPMNRAQRRAVAKAMRRIALR